MQAARAASSVLDSLIQNDIKVVVRNVQKLNTNVRVQMSAARDDARRSLKKTEWSTD